MRATMSAQAALFGHSPPAKEMSVRRSNPEVAYPRSKRR